MAVTSTRVCQVRDRACYYDLGSQGVTYKRPIFRIFSESDWDRLLRVTNTWIKIEQQILQNLSKIEERDVQNLEEAGHNFFTTLCTAKGGKPPSIIRFSEIDEKEQRTLWDLLFQLRRCVQEHQRLIRGKPDLAGLGAAQFSVVQTMVCAPHRDSWSSEGSESTLSTTSNVT